MIGEDGDHAVARLRVAVEEGRIDLNRARKALVGIKEKRDRLASEARDLERRRPGRKRPPSRPAPSGRKPWN